MLRSNGLGIASLAQGQSKQLSSCCIIAPIPAANTHRPRLKFTLTACAFSPTLVSPTVTTTTTVLPTLEILQFNKIASHRTGQILRHFSSWSGPSDKMSYGKQPSEFSVRKVGAPNTLEFRAFIEKDGTPVSPFHDVPLYANEQQMVLNMIVEIPRWTNAKLEVRLPPAD